MMIDKRVDIDISGVTGGWVREVRSRQRPDEIGKVVADVLSLEFAVSAKAEAAEVAAHERCPAVVHGDVVCPHPAGNVL